MASFSYPEKRRNPDSNEGVRRVLRRRALVLLAAAAYAVSAGCAHRAEMTDATDDSPYGPLFGKSFRTKTALFLLQDTAEPGLKYFGFRDGPVERPAGLPPDLGKAHVGEMAGTMKVLDIVPAGAEFTVEAATHDVLTPSGETIGLLCKLMYDGKVAAVVNAEFIQVHSDKPGYRPNPTINEAIAAALKH